MFTSKCKERKGFVLGTCRQNFIFGACCVDEAVEGASDLSQNSTDASGILSSIEKLLSKLDKPALILSNGQIMPIQEVDKTRPLPSSDPNEDELEQESEETTTKNSVKIEENNIESMMDSLLDSVIEKFDSELPNLLDELSTEEMMDNDQETTELPKLESIQAGALVSSTQT